MRIFFALEPDERTAMAIADWRDRQGLLIGRPVTPANFHITLAFVGEADNPELDRLCQAVDNRTAATSADGGSITLDRTGYWPRPGIYWLGPSQWPSALADLAATLQQLSVSTIGAKRDKRKFQPHMTLLRGCDQAPPAPAHPPAFTFRYNHFTLFESRQGRRGVSYHPLLDWPLAGESRGR